jgi:hypothetical protein
MWVTAKLFGLLTLELWADKEDDEDSLASEWEKILRDKCSVDMPAPSPDQTTFFTRFSAAGINRPQALAIISNHQLFLAGIRRRWPQKEQTRLLEEIWRRYHELVSLLVQAHVSITEEQWKAEARELGRLYVKCWGRDEVTPYLHVFIYHIGYYLEQYGGIEKFGNYALEGKHSCNKAILQRMTSRFKFGKEGAVRQQLLTNLRLEQHQYGGYLKKGKKVHGREEESWALGTLEAAPRYADYVVSSTHIGAGVNKTW